VGCCLADNLVAGCAASGDLPVLVRRLGEFGSEFSQPHWHWPVPYRQHCSELFDLEFSQPHWHWSVPYRQNFSEPKKYRSKV